MNQDYNDETYINNLVDQYKQTGDEALKLKLLDAFDPYFNKYVYLLCTNKMIDIGNKDTITFLRLFMDDEDRSTPSNLASAAKRTISYVRGIFSDCTPEDIYDEMVCIFLQQLTRYKPMIANHKHSQERISFTHFLQVNTRYKLKNISAERANDALHGYNVEFHDELNGIPNDNGHTNYSSIDLWWVRGDTAGDLFDQLDAYERYLLYLKYEDQEEKPLSEYDLARLTGQDRMYIRRRMIRIKNKLKRLALQT